MNWLIARLPLVVGIPVSALAGDALTGIVTGVGAGAIVALRLGQDHSYRARMLAILLTGLATFVLVRLVGSAALLPAPILPFIAIGVADHLSELDQGPSAAPVTASRRLTREFHPL